MNVTETLAEGLKRELTVVVEAAKLQALTEERLQAVSKNVKMPGFRPGKIPANVLKQRYGQQVAGEVLERAIEQASRDALDQKGYTPALRPRVTIKQFAEGQNLEFTMSFDLMPTPPAVELGDITVERDVFEVSEADIKDGLDRLGKANKRLKPVEKARKAEKGDILRIDFLGKVDGVPFDGGKAENFTIEIGSGQLIPGFEEQLIGLKPGDSTEVKVTFPEDYHAENLKGKAATFDVTARELLEAELPAMDDEFAKLSGFKDLADLKERVKEKITRDVDAVVRMRQKKALFDALDSKVKFDLPQSMVDEEFGGIWQKLVQTQPDAESDEALKQEYRQVAERRVKLGLYLAEVAKQQAIRVNQQELQQAVMEQARMFPGQENKVVEFYRKNPVELTNLQGPILEEKAVDYVLTQVKLKDKKTTVEAIVAEENKENEAEAATRKPAKKAASKKSEA
jgi:trigger factor